MNWGNLIQPITGPNEYRYDLEMKKERGGKRLIKKKTCVSLKVWSQAHQHQQQLEVVRKANSQTPPVSTASVSGAQQFVFSKPTRKAAVWE